MYYRGKLNGMKHVYKHKEDRIHSIPYTNGKIHGDYLVKDM